MSLIHPLLGWFMLLGIIPVILHLLLRAKPKKLMFPALRLIQNRKRQNVQRMRLKHFWLMLLRVAIIVVLVLAVARPRIPPVNYWPTTIEWATLGSIILIALGIWFGLNLQWRKQRLPPFQMQHRRTLLRAGVLGGVVLLTLLLVLWPLQRRVFAQIKEPQAPVSENVPVASVMLFDTSLSMQYRQSGHTRLETARDLATEYLRRLPAGSRVAVAETSSTNPISFLPELATAGSRLGALDVKAATSFLNERIRNALDLQKEDLARTLEVDTAVPAENRQDSFVREIIVFTDMSPAAWQQSETNLLKAELARDKAVNLYLLDVSATQPTNVGLSDLKVRDATLSTGGELQVSATATSIGRPPGSTTVTLSLPDETGKLVLRESQSVELNGNEATIAQIAVRGITGNIIQGELRLKSDDPLEFDNALYFTVEVQPPEEVLVVSDTKEDSLHWSIALAPEILKKLGRVKYNCTRITSNKLESTELAKYGAVCLLNVHTLSERTWKQLADYVEAGGGVAVALGSPVDPVSYNSEIAQTFLPGELLAHLALIPPEYIDLTNKLDHPLLKKFAEQEGGAAQLTTADINRIWRVKAKPNASVIAWYTFANRSPAILERVSGKGRTVMITTSVSSRASDELDQQWNSLTNGRWAYVAFADQTIRYLSRQSQGTFNYVCGEDAIVRLDAERPLQQYLLRKPNSQQLPGEVAPGKPSVVIRTVDQLGHFRLLDAAVGSTFQRGFSVNAPPRENVLTPISTAQLDEILGKDRYSQARGFEQLDKKGLGGQRIGLEVFPILMLIMWLVFMGEHLVANRFYDAEPNPAVT